MSLDWVKLRWEQYGLTPHEVPGDGSCMFHCCSFWFPEKTDRQWRTVLCDRVQERYDAAPTQREKNNIFGHGREAFKTQDPKTGVFIDKYQTFEDLMEAMRKDEYGYSMFWEEFAAETDSAIHTFFARGREQYLRSLQGPIPSNDLFVVNDKTKHGKPQPCIYCIYIVYILYIFCVYCYI